MKKKGNVSRGGAENAEMGDYQGWTLMEERKGIDNARSI
jgi:hypothetical protein